MKREELRTVMVFLELFPFNFILLFSEIVISSLVWSFTTPFISFVLFFGIFYFIPLFCFCFCFVLSFLFISYGSGIVVYFASVVKWDLLY